MMPEAERGANRGRSWEVGRMAGPARGGAGVKNPETGSVPQVGACPRGQGGCVVEGLRGGGLPLHLPAGRRKPLACPGVVAPAQKCHDESSEGQTHLGSRTGGGSGGIPTPLSIRELAICGEEGPA